MCHKWMRFWFWEVVLSYTLYHHDNECFVVVVVVAVVVVDVVVGMIANRRLFVEQKVNYLEPGYNN